jgi:hypothetical protein
MQSMYFLDGFNKSEAGDDPMFIALAEKSD